MGYTVEDIGRIVGEVRAEGLEQLILDESFELSKETDVEEITLEPLQMVISDIPSHCYPFVDDQIGHFCCYRPFPDDLFGNFFSLCTFVFDIV